LFILFLDRKLIRAHYESMNGTMEFPVQKCAIFCKFKEIKELRGGVLRCAAQAISQNDAEIAEKGHL